MNLRQPISASSDSKASFFTIVGVKHEGIEEVASLSCTASLMCSYRYMGYDWYVTDQVMVAS